MTSIEEIFPALETEDIKDPEIQTAWSQLWDGLSGAPVTEQAREWQPAIEPSLVDQYIEDMRFHFYRDGGIVLTDDLNGLAQNVEACFRTYREPLEKLTVSPTALQWVHDAFSACLRTSLASIDLQQLIEQSLKWSLDKSCDSVKILRQIGQLEMETDKALANVIPGLVDEMVTRMCKGIWCRPMLEICEHVVPREFSHFLKAAGFSDIESLDRHILSLTRTKFAELRIQELFQLVTLFPDTTPAVEDLHTAMDTPALRSMAISTFQAECSTLLLNAGVDTVNIFLGLLKTMAAFPLLDPRGVLLDKALRPIQRYVKERPDTVEILVDGLLGEPHSPLSFLTAMLAPPPAERLAATDDINDVNWVPAPVDAPPEFVARQNADIVATLFSLYDNKEVFVKQLATIFSTKLLVAETPAALDELIAKADALSKRFERRQLQSIYVMIRDIRDSLDFQRRAHALQPSLQRVRALFLSQRYWPSIPSAGTIKMPTRIQCLVDEYAKQYESITGDRTVTWLPNMGRVAVTLELVDRKLDLTVTPEQAIIITAFENEGSLGLAELQSITHLEEPRILDGLRFWLGQEVLGVDGEKYRVLETRAEIAAAQEATVVAAPVSQAQQSNGLEEMKVYWSYIVGMLKNLGELPTEKIHSFLVMFVPKDDPYVKTKQELETFLHLMVDENELAHSDGKFSLPKATT